MARQSEASDDQMEDGPAKTQVQNCQRLVNQSASVLNQCSSVQQLLQKVHQNVKQNATEIEVSTKSIMTNLEFKIAHEIQPGMQEDIQYNMILEFCQ